jgi:hypothetical protein
MKKKEENEKRQRYANMFNHTPKLTEIPEEAEGDYLFVDKSSFYRKGKYCKWYRFNWFIFPFGILFTWLDFIFDGGLIYSSKTEKKDKE